MKQHPLILVVDDDEMFLKIVHDILLAEGFEVIKTTKAEKALFLIARCSPDLVLLDIMMPDYDGFQTLKMIRHRSDIPVIMLTCLDDKTTLSKAMLNGGADDYVTKPFNPVILIARIKARLRRCYDISQNSADPVACDEENSGNNELQEAKQDTNC